MAAHSIPVLLRLSDVAPNSNLSFQFTTRHVKWSLGAGGGDSLGFSYNVTPDDVLDSPTSPIQGIAFNDGLLEVRTAPAGTSLSQFSLSLFLELDEDVHHLEGYCTLNDEATVQAQFGGDRPAYWRNGRISATLRRSEGRYCAVRLGIKGALPGSYIEIDVASERDERVRWSIGPPVDGTEGLRVLAAQGPLPLLSFSVTETQIRLRARPPGAASADFFVGAYLAWEPADLRFVYLKAACDPGVSVYAQLGNRQPQYLSPTYTHFML